MERDEYEAAIWASQQQLNEEVAAAHAALLLTPAHPIGGLQEDAKATYREAVNAANLAHGERVAELDARWRDAQASKG